MATKPQSSAPGAGPQHFTPPTARELRAQAVNRLQVGLFGLAAMLLLVGLANIIMERARLADASAPPANVAAEAATPKSDPLADLGVIPSPEAGKPSATPHD